VRKSKGKRQISKGKSVELSFQIEKTSADLLPFDICLLPFDFCALALGQI
jgi:hypothetical protein